MELNNKFEYYFSFSQNDVQNFAKVTGDSNPIHLDEKIASKSIFKRRIIHGFLSGSVFSKVFGTIWPGNGTIYLSQTMKFMKPMYADENYIAKFEVIEILNYNKFLVNTQIFDTNHLMMIDGKALIKYEV